MVKNVREIWDIAAEKNLLHYLGYSNILNEKLLKSIAKQNFKKITKNTINNLVDCGCGICTYDVYWSKNINRIIGIDVSPKIIQEAKRRIKAFDAWNIDLIVADICHLPLRKWIADAAVSLGVLKHIPKNPYSTMKALIEICRIVKKGGKVYVNDLPHIFHPDAWIYKIGIFLYSKLLKLFTTSSYFYPPSYLRKLILNLNVKEAEFSSYGWRFPLSSIISFIPLISLRILLWRYFFLSQYDNSRKIKSKLINWKLLQFHSIEIVLTL
jgi:ubiquinone/menaquinone biosynthesis C-methylase UbiE